ncbi:MAG: hypothetical protein QOG68_187 [Solirubrobacteraceae bacterium]|nr:hypothetical protein [Solirubrobacteraceae bacterium]
MSPRARATTAVLVAALVAAGCGKSSTTTKTVLFPTSGSKGDQPQAAVELGFPIFATKNTTRVAGADPIADAAAIARAVFPSVSAGDRPKAVALVDVKDWRSALAASVLMSAPIRAPVLFSDGTSLPSASADALTALAPSGSEPAGGAQVVRIGDVARPKGLKTTDLVGRDPASLARAIDAFQASARGVSADNVLVVSYDKPEYAMPAAAWAAKTGDPILFATKDTLPEPTRVAIAAHQQPHIYVLGPSSVISPKVTRLLRTLGTVVRVGDQDPQSNAVAFAKYADSNFGWGVIDPGHGLVFASPTRPADAAAAAPLSASGTYGPLLLVDGSGEVPKPVSDFLLDIQPGYSKDPTRGVYNHGWIIGDDTAVSVAAQAKIDSALEIVPAKNSLPSKP